VGQRWREWRWQAVGVTAQDDVIAVFDEVADTYDAVDVDFFTPMGAELVRRAAIAPGESVLDVGCGRGAVLLPAARAAGPTGHVTGIDLSSAMVALTAAATAGMAGVTVLLGDAQAPAFDAASFDVVTAGLVLFFLADPIGAVAAYRRLLRPGGRLALSSFAAYDPRYPNALRRLAAHAIDPPPPAQTHELFHSERTLRDGLTAQGFTDVTVTPYQVRSRFRDTGHFLQWVGSHAGRRIVQRIPAARRTAAVDDLVGVLGPADQALALTTTIRITVATS
jgi:ubiquinone/menaquinone biosynthesis C-methylase UbiE